MTDTEPIALRHRLIILVFLAPVLVLAACTTGAGSADPAGDSPSPEASPESPAIDEDEAAWIQEARDRFEEGQDQLTPVNIPDRYGVQINGEDFIVLETTTFEADGHYQEITSLISSGQWEELEQFGELTDEAQDLIEDGEVRAFLAKHGHLQESEPAIDNDVTVYFPEWKEPEDDEPYIHRDADPVDRLALDDNGCLRMEGTGDLIIWPSSEFNVDLVEDEVVVIDADDGDVLFQVGDKVQFHGSSRANPDYPPLKRPLPDACTSASFFHTGWGTSKVE